MLNTKIRRTLIALTASASFGGAAVVPAVSHAQAVNGAGGGNSCLFHINPDGTFVTVADGETVLSPSGKRIKCNNGTWVVVARVVSPVIPVPVSPVVARPPLA